MKVVLCGYNWTGCRVLEHLLQRQDVSDIAVFTHEPPPELPDLRPLASAVGIWCTTESINQVPLPFAADVIASVYYRFIVKPHVIASVRGRIFNMHPSLLPRHRGCSSIPWAIIEGDTVTGVTFHYMDESIDTGRIILQAAVPIASDETQASLFRRCMHRGVEFWPAALELVKAGFPGAPAQGASSFHKRGAPYGGVIQEGWPVDQVERFIRAMIFPPYPSATFRGHEIKSLADYMQVIRFEATSAGSSQETGVERALKCNEMKAGERKRSGNCRVRPRKGVNA